MNPAKENIILKANMKKFNKACMQTCVAASVAAARNEFDFGPDRMERFVKAFMKEIDCINAGTVNAEELLVMVTQETGVDLVTSWVANDPIRDELRRRL